MHPLVQKMFQKDRAALARLMTHVESRSPEMPQILAQIAQKLGHAQIIGITGPPGAGKSTLVDRLIGQYRQLGKTVGVVAIDPSSPFSGGALLGDRIRMMDHTADTGVFIRSLGTRGAHGGLSRATRDIVRLLDAFGFDVILVETVGVGQTELDVLELVHSAVVVLTPESGDTIQTLKAGLLEAADIFAVNKSDREGASKIQSELKAMLEIGQITRPQVQDWIPPVLALQANQGKGVEGLIRTLAEHYQQVVFSSLHAEKQAKIRVQEFKELILEFLERKLAQEAFYAASLKQVQEGQKSPFETLLELQKQVQVSFKK